jgi:selenocysteine lyase/cysteine desulfurase
MLEQYFKPFRKNIIGRDQIFETPFGKKRIIYADWTASGRLYKTIEDKLNKEIYPFVGNTHTETSVTGSVMTLAYHKALQMIKDHVHANQDDIIISSNSGMTGVINKFQRILGFKLHEKHQPYCQLPEDLRPVIFCTHMEHHSNQTTWLESIGTVEVIEPNEEGLVDLDFLAGLIEKYKDRKIKIAAITSCSNVTGIITPYHIIAEMIHKAGGYCFVDFAASGPYIDIDMHPSNPVQHLDAIYFSPHKFLGGPGTAGVLIFNRKLYSNKIPDNPGGGTVDWTNPWGQHKYVDDIEAREDGGTPSFLQTIRTALCIQLKESMGTDNMLQREEELMEIVWPRLKAIPNLHLLADKHRKRLGIISFYIDDLHYNLAVKLLNDRYGIQTRGGCSCAGTYGHYLLHVDEEYSQKITSKINQGDLTEKPGWVRFSVHPTMTDEEANYIATAIKELSENFKEWASDYKYNRHTNEFEYIQSGKSDAEKIVEKWF